MMKVQEEKEKEVVEGGWVDDEDEDEEEDEVVHEAAGAVRGWSGGSRRLSLKRKKRNGYDRVDMDGGMKERGGREEMEEMEDGDGSTATDPSSSPPVTSSSITSSSSSSSSTSPSPPPLTLSSVLIAGAGFMCDAYDLFIMNVVLVVMGCEYGVTSSDTEPSSPSSVCELSARDKSVLASAVLVGSIVGQLLFGVLADGVGRRRGFILTLSILIVGATLSALAQPVLSLDLFAVLALARFVLGVGVGGEYPLSATVSSEATVNSEGRGRRVSAVFAMQGVGLIIAPTVVLILLATQVSDRAGSYVHLEQLAVVLVVLMMCVVDVVLCCVVVVRLGVAVVVGFGCCARCGDAVLAVQDEGDSRVHSGEGGEGEEQEGEGEWYTAGTAAAHTTTTTSRAARSSRTGK